MKTILLAGGYGTRLSEETDLRPKPMIILGDRPMLSHIMGMYARHGFDDFLVAGGYRVDFIKNFFANLPMKLNDYRIDLKTGEVEIYGNNSLDWKVAIIDTGLNTMTGGRIKRLASFVGNETCMATYGDGVANVDIAALVAFHKSHGKKATVTAVRPPARFGNLVIEGDQVTAFEEKNPLKEGWINGGFFVLEPEVFDYIDDDTQPFEREPLARLANDGELMVFKHEGFWQPMDTLREKQELEKLWKDGLSPWDPDNC
ncbi:MAG: glucose-1-phosphate cytidylyltransferase [Cocleimonas sp.]